MFFYVFLIFFLFGNRIGKQNEPPPPPQPIHPPPTCGEGVAAVVEELPQGTGGVGAPRLLPVYRVQAL